jgi:hypothetical protein
LDAERYLAALEDSMLTQDTNDAAQVAQAGVL